MVLSLLFSVCEFSVCSSLCGVFVFCVFLPVSLVIFPPHLSCVCLISPALLPEFVCLHSKLALHLLH